MNIAGNGKCKSFFFSLSIIQPYKYQIHYLTYLLDSISFFGFKIISGIPTFSVLPIDYINH